MGDADDLIGFGETADACADRGGGRAPDAGVDFVEDQSAAVARAGEDDDQREQNAREFAAGCDARERSERFAGVRGKGELGALGAGRADRFERYELKLEPRRP